MRRRGGWAAFVVLAAGCASTASDRPSSGGVPADSAPGAARVLTIAQSRPLKAFAIDTNTSGGVVPLTEIHTLGLITQDASGVDAARLATELPSIQRGTIALLPDGWMETIWWMRTDVTWHDGAPFTAADVVFSSAVKAEPEMRSAGMENLRGIDTIDTTTVRFTWKHPFFDAVNLTPSDFWLMPRHILEEAFEGDRSDSRALSS